MGVRSFEVIWRAPAAAEPMRPKHTEVSEEGFMTTALDTARSTGLGFTKKFRAAAAAWLLLGGPAVLAKPAEEAAGGEANLKLPDLSQVSFLGVDGHRLLLYGLVICVFGLLFGMAIFNRLKNMPV